MSEFERVRQALLGIPAGDMEPTLRREFPKAWTGYRVVPILEIDDGRATFRPTDTGHSYRVVIRDGVVADVAEVITTTSF
jgi:hypothetical protein